MKKLNPYDRKIAKKIFGIWEKKLKKDNDYIPFFPLNEFIMTNKTDISIYKKARVLVKDENGTQEDLEKIEGIKVELPASYTNFEPSFVINNGDGRRVEICTTDYPLTWQARLNQWLDQL